MSFKSQDKDVDNFFNFLAKHLIKKEKSDVITHTAFGAPWGAYNISGFDLDTFIKYYKKVMKKVDLHITQKPADVGPLLLDLDFKFDMKDKERKYGDDDILYVIKKINKVIKKYVDVTSTKKKMKKLISFVLEKPAPTHQLKQGKYKDGFHIEYPKLPIKYSTRELIITEVRDEIEREKGFKHIPYINDMKDIFDLSVIKTNGWMMYGSRKHDGQLYKLTQIYDENEKIIKTHEYAEDELVSLLCVQQYEEDQCLKFRDEIDDDEYESKIKEIEKKYNKSSKKKDKKPKKDNDSDSENESENEDVHKDKKKHGFFDFGQNDTDLDEKNKDIEMAKKLVEILSKSRSKEYEPWLHVGWALHNIGDELYSTFIKFSKKSAKEFDENGCKKLWEKARTSGFGLPSLHNWAKIDNAVGYREVMRSNIRKVIKEAESGTHDDIAKVVYELYKHVFKCASIKKNVWYEFRNHRWNMVENGYTLSNIISDEITKEFAFLSSYYMMESAQKNGAEADNDRKKAEYVIRIVNNLKRSGFKNQLMEACTHRFIDPHFEEKLDSSLDIIGFNNGVFDLKEGQFRAGTPEDFLTMSTGYDWKEFKDTDDEVKEVKNYFKQVMREEDMRDYILTLLASYLDGHIVDQKFILWTGTGCHQPGTKILMHDGKYKKVEDIELGEKLMGDNSRPRNVKCLFNGQQDMYKIEYLDKPMHSKYQYTVNKNHRLALTSTFQKKVIWDDEFETWRAEWHEYIENVPISRNKHFAINENNSKDDVYAIAIKFLNDKENQQCNFIRYGEVIAVMVSDYIDLGVAIKQYYKGYRSVVKFDKKETAVDPYVYGTNLNNHKTIINEHKCNSKNHRLRLIAGIIDKYGAYNPHTCSYEIAINNVTLQNDIIYVVESLGYNVDKMNDKISIPDDFIDKVPIITSYKNPNHIKGNILAVETGNKKQLYDIKTTYVGKGNFHGFQIDGNEKYIIENFITTYNSNGKSTTVDLVRNGFGNYFDVLPITVLTRKRGSAGNATPELANKRGKRCLVIQEPEHDDTIYVGFMKELTGGDYIMARALYGDPFVYKPQFKLLLTCNKLPQIPSNDGGTWRRLRVSPWESEFVDGEPKFPNQFKKDNRLTIKMKLWSQAFMWLLIRVYYPKYIKSGISEPQKVKIFTDKYQKNSNVYHEYISEFMTPTGNKDDAESLNDIYRSFKAWFKDAYNGGKCVPRKEFYDYMTTRKEYKIENLKLIGYKMSEKTMDLDN